MKQIAIVLCVLIIAGIITACAPKKPELDKTQVVNGKSIIVPPEFDVRP